MKKLKLLGLLAAPFTPFDEAGEVRYDLIARQAESLIRDGVCGAYIGGTTGEGISCSVDERLKLMDAWQEAAHGKLLLIAHTGALSLKDVEVLSRHAADLKYDAFSVIPPTFFRPASVAMLVDYCAAAAATAPELPFYYYHTMNSLVNLPMHDFLDAADGKIPNLAGIKFNHHNLYDYQNARNACGGKYDVVFGVDEFFIAALAFGAESFIGSTYNYSAPLYRTIWDAYRCGDAKTAGEGMRKVCRGVDLLVANGGISAGKAMMLLKGIDCGPARLPLKHLNPAERQAVARAMDRVLTEIE